MKKYFLRICGYEQFPRKRVQIDSSKDQLVNDYAQVQKMYEHSH
jgi:hypothetical protein